MAKESIEEFDPEGEIEKAARRQVDQWVKDKLESGQLLPPHGLRDAIQRSHESEWLNTFRDIVDYPELKGEKNPKDLVGILTDRRPHHIMSVSGERSGPLVFWVETGGLDYGDGSSPPVSRGQCFRTQFYPDNEGSRAFDSSIETNGKVVVGNRQSAAIYTTIFNGSTSQRFLKAK
jgi:hypothetical protein